MTEFRDQDLNRSRLERASLPGVTVTHADLNDAIVVDREWEHRLYAERALTALEKED